MGKNMSSYCIDCNKLLLTSSHRLRCWPCERERRSDQMTEAELDAPIESRRPTMPEEPGVIGRKPRGAK